MKDININKHIWEGWTVGDFINTIEPAFNWTLKQYGKKYFENNSLLKQWVREEQPYYKKHIPEVYRYFLNKLNTNT